MVPGVIEPNLGRANQMLDGNGPSGLLTRPKPTNVSDFIVEIDNCMAN
jgi:hypothetical protein